MKNSNHKFFSTRIITRDLYKINSKVIRISHSFRNDKILSYRLYINSNLYLNNIRFIVSNFTVFFK